MENENDDLDISTQEEEVAHEETTEPEEESVEELKARLEDEKQARLKAEEIANNQKIRAEKAENKTKGVESKPKPERKDDLSSKDLYSLMDAKVPQDDVDDVVEYAKYAKISIAEALKSNVVKTILKDKAEMRNVAEATNTGSSRRSSGKISDEALLEKASKGEMPESDADLARLVAARRAK